MKKRVTLKSGRRSTFAQWRFGSALLVSASVTLFGCKSDDGSEQVAPESSEVQSVPIPENVAEVRLRPMPEAGESRRETELRGLVTALLEAGLADLYGVVPSVENVPLSPGLMHALQAGAEHWTIDVHVASASKDRADILLSVCNPSAQCGGENAQAYGDPSQAVAELLTKLSEILGRQPLPSTQALWEKRQSEDAYAVLLAGRAAATFYGFFPSQPQPERQDRRLDPVERAIYVDPQMPIGQWIVARRRMAAKEYGSARLAFSRAGVIHPQRVLYLADEASSLSSTSQSEAALSTWQQIAERAPRDPRFAVPLARALLAAGRATEAAKNLDRLPLLFQREPRVLKLRVEIADVLGRGKDDDDLLSRWQEAAPEDPEPVRRRIQARIRDHRLEEALDLVAELGRRGVPDEALRLELSIDVSLGRFREAREAARALGLREVEQGLALRIALEEKQPQIELADGATGLELTAVGERYLAAGDPSHALAFAEKVLSSDAWLPEALLLRVKALRALGRSDEADRTALRLAYADPALAMREGIRVVPPATPPSIRIVRTSTAGPMVLARTITRTSTGTVRSTRTSTSGSVRHTRTSTRGDSARPTRTSTIEAGPRLTKTSTVRPSVEPVRTSTRARRTRSSTTSREPSAQLTETSTGARISHQPP
jgi:Tfp pilus assembly protein PilF